MAIVHHQVDGDPDHPAVVLSNSLGTNLTLWAPQLEALTERFQVVRYDSRGHGDSATPHGPYTIEDLGGDVLALLDELNLQRAHFVGISIGGLIGQYLAARHPDRIDRLVVANTAAAIGEPSAWHERAGLVRASGMAAIASGVVERWLTRDYAAEHPETVAWLTDMLLTTDPAGYAATCHVLATTDLRPEIGGVTAPTLAIGATDDGPTPAEVTRDIAESIPGAEYLELEAAHISNVEQADAFTSALLDFLS